ncbi:MAG TPA: CU044_2847 family protein [Lentzea sp.]
MEFDRKGGRQISSTNRTASLLEDRRAEIEAGIASAADIVRTSMANAEEKNGWRVSSVEATFGITLSAEAGVIITKASAEASFEVTMTIERA